LHTMGAESNCRSLGEDAEELGCRARNLRKSWVSYLYAFMSRMRLPKSYLGKAVLVAFVDTCARLATLVPYAVLASLASLREHPGALVELCSRPLS
jgi:hypothetical protein